MYIITIIYVDTHYMDRNLHIEERIRERTKYDILHQINSYGGMGMDGITGDEKRKRLEEIDYMNNHPEIYRKNAWTYKK